MAEGCRTSSCSGRRPRRPSGTRMPLVARPPVHARAIFPPSRYNSPVPARLSSPPARHPPASSPVSPFCPPDPRQVNENPHPAPDQNRAREQAVDPTPKRERGMISRRCPVTAEPSRPLTCTRRRPAGRLSPGNSPPLPPPNPDRARLPLTGRRSVKGQEAPKDSPPRSPVILSAPVILSEAKNLAARPTRALRCSGRAPSRPIRTAPACS